MNNWFQNNNYILNYSAGTDKQKRKLFWLIFLGFFSLLFGRFIVSENWLYGAIILGLPFVIVIPNYYWVISFVFLFPMSLSSLIPSFPLFGKVDVQIIDIIVVIMLTKLVFSNLLKKRKYILTRIGKFIGLYLCTLILSLLFIYFKGYFFVADEFIAFARFLSQIVVFFILVNLKLDLDGIRILCNTLIYIGCFYALSLLIQFILIMSGIQIGSSYLFGNTEVRATGLLMDPSAGSLYLSLFIFITMSLIGTLKSEKYFIFLAIIFSIAFLLTGTRGSFIAFLVGLSALIIFSAKRTVYFKKKGKLIFFSILAVTCAIFVPYLNTAILRFSGYSLMVGIGSRIIPMVTSLKILLDNPYLGVGYSGGRFFNEGYNANLNLVDIGTRGSYNQYIEVALNSGFIGLGFYLLLVFNIMKISFQTADSECFSDEYLKGISIGIFVWFCALFIGAQTEAWLTAGSLVGYLFWVSLGIMIQINKLCVQNNENGYWKKIKERRK